MKKPLLRERDTYSAGKYESHKAGDVYDVLFRARKLITMKRVKCHLRKNGVFIEENSGGK